MAPLPTAGASRRALFRVAGGAGLATLAACTNTPAAAPSKPPGSTSTESKPSVNSAPTSRILLAYFSRAGENYWYGDRRILQVGNTEVLAGKISARIGCTTYRIRATDPYPTSYADTVARNVKEQNEDARPAIGNALPDLAGYDVVILASPIWNVRPPMIMTTFTEAVNLAGKTIYPMTTHAMSGLGRAKEIYTAAAPLGVLGAGLAVQGELVSRADDQIATWIRSINL